MYLGRNELGFWDFIIAVKKHHDFGVGSRKKMRPARQENRMTTKEDGAQAKKEEPERGSP